MLIETIFEDEDILVINKPSGMVVHPYDYSTEDTLVDFLKISHPDIFLIDNAIILQDEREIPLGGIVHKLDRDTSGVMVIAKTQYIFDILREKFLEHSVQKAYVAVVEGVVHKNIFTIDAPLGRNKKDYKQSTSPENPRGPLRPAVTDVRVIKTNMITTLVVLEPKTGRTHQLRAHMASIGNPIVGDIAYGSTLQKERIMLHAETLSFEINGRQYSFEAGTPKEFLY